MQFITLDQRIAVENFEVGVIYTVTFTNGDNFTGSCIGIGVDFVAFQRSAPELLFCLTMATAADVAIIEPLPADIGEILEYTGSVPVSIKTDGSPILDYLITGNTIQNGTPTPSTPVPVVGVGELDSGQYKIPILSNSTTIPVYLNEVQTKRIFRKKVLDGTENILPIDSSKHIYALRGIFNDAPQMLGQPSLCTHLIYNSITSGLSNNMHNGEYVLNKVVDDYSFTVKIDTVSSSTELKTWLQQQYAAGTPVSVWYVLATEEIAVVNEPLMRIGDYADTLSYRQSDVNVPTTDGLNIFDVDTTVKPSEVYIKYFSPLF